MNNVRFGICTDQNLPFDALVERWQYFESLGFDSVWDCDHFNQPSQPTGPYFEAWTTLAALATETSTIRIGVLVSSNTFRHPALLAQQAITVDHISNGRLELGFGGGWFEPEHERLGIEFPAPAERVDRFYEAVQILDSLLTQESTDFDGKYWQLAGAYLRPRPVQRPRPPLTLGAHKTRMLRICAEYADAWNSFGSVEQIAERNAILDSHCRDLGRDPTDIWRSLYVWASEMERQGMPDPWESVDAFEEVVGRYGEAGINEFIVDHPSDDKFHVMESAASDVIPRLQQQT